MKIVDAAAPDSTRDFLVKVGVVAMAIVVTLSLLRLFAPDTDRLICHNDGVNGTGVAARGRGTTIALKLMDPKGEIYWTKMIQSPEFTCSAAFGEGWNVRN